MTATVDTATTDPTTTTVRIRPRYEGSNICTWIGFKHVNYLVEEAVLDHLRQRGMAPGELYERYGLCVDITHIDTRILHAFHIDDVAVASVTCRSGMTFDVSMEVAGDPPTKAVTSKVRVELRHDPRGGDAEPVPAELVTSTVDQIRAERPDAMILPEPGADPLASLVAGRNAFGWKWRIPYFYCHFTERVQMSGYLRLMEEVVDLFLEDRGISIKRLLDEQDWIPVVPHSKITLLDEARMEEDLYIVFTVEDVFKAFTYTARMDCYVLRDGAFVPTATGRITHGYALIENRRDWHLVNFDDRMLAGLAGKRPSDAVPPLRSGR